VPGEGHHRAETALIDAEAVISALVAVVLPGSAGEERMLRLAASLGEAITGTDATPACWAVRHASGRRQF
jgi:hypothetical protein